MNKIKIISSFAEKNLTESYQQCLNELKIEATEKVSYGYIKMVPSAEIMKVYLQGQVKNWQFNFTRPAIG